MIKRILFYLFFIGCFGSCDVSELAPPESATVQGKPAVHVPVGYISETGGRTGAAGNIDRYVSDEKIKEMLRISDAPDGTSPRLYPYTRPVSDVRTYLIHQPIAEQDLDLSRYVKALDMTDSAGKALPELIPGTGGYVSVPISLASITEWITEVTNARFIVRLSMSGSRGPVSVQFAYLGATETQTKPFAETLEFISAPINPFNPNAEVIIGIKALEGTDFKAEFDFDWEQAVINPNNAGANLGTFKGRYAGLNLSDLTGFLGGGIAFAEVNAYLYIDGLPSDEAEATLSSGGVQLCPPAPVRPAPMPPDVARCGRLPLPSVDKINLNAQFSSNAEFALDYEISMGRIAVSKDSARGRTVKADMIIELPLEFIVSGSTGNPRYRDYVPLSLKDVMPAMGTEDLFGRTGSEDGVLGRISEITVRAGDCRNTIIAAGGGGPITLGIYVPGTANGGGLVLINGKSSKASLTGAYPFAPKFEILVPKDPGKSTGTLQILRPKEVAFDFFLELDALAQIEETVDFF